MSKYRKLIIISVISILAIITFVGMGIFMSTSSSKTLAGDGYILSGEAETDPYYFAAGTRIAGKYPDSMVFQDIEGETRRVGQESFVHYMDDSLSATTDGVLVNLDDVNSGIVNHYGIRPQVVLTAGNGGYSVENNDSEITFRNLLWKLSEERLLLSSQGATLTLPSGETVPVSGYLEAEYLEDGIVSLANAEQSWQVVSDGTYMTMDNGVRYDFGSKILSDAQGNSRMTFQEMLLDADDNIQVQSAQDWVPPEFDFTTIDGQQGQDGAEGQAGQAGQAGEQGEEGKAGEAGEDGDVGEEGGTGSRGSSGAGGGNGASGANGADGSLTDKETMAQASFQITEFDLTAGSLQVVFTVTDDDGVLDGQQGSIHLYDSNGNDIEMQSDLGDLSEVSFMGDMEYTVTCNNLNPDMEYRFVVNSGYVLKNISGTKDYINRTFYTDSSGLELEKLFATEGGFTMKLSRKEYSTAESARISVLNDKGETVMVYEVGGDALADGTVELSTDAFHDQTGLGRLASNTNYSIKMEAFVNGAYKDNGVRQKWTTLKKKPTLGRSEGYANSQTYFDLSVSEVNDPDSAIVGYRYEIYDQTNGGKRVETLTSPKSSQVPLYIGTTTDGDHEIARGVFYTVTVTAIYHDNEKTAEVSTIPSEGFMMSDKGEASVSFTWKEGADRVTTLDGTLTIDPKNYGSIAISEQYPLSVQVESTGNYHKKMTFNQQDIDKYTQEGKINLPITLKGLKDTSSYRISVWAWVSAGQGAGGEKLYEYRLLGDVMTSTATHNKVKAKITAANNGTAVGCYISLGEKDDVIDTTIKSIRAVEAKLYLGAAPASDDSNLLATCIAVEDNKNLNDPYNGAIADQYWGIGEGDPESDRIYIDEGSFSKSMIDMTASQYSIKISAIYDYTYNYGYIDENIGGYKNVVPLTEDSTPVVRLNVDNRVPDFPSPLDSGVIATPITNGKLTELTGIKKEEELADETIVGYRLSASYDNSGSLARSVTYYAMSQADINEYRVDPDTSKGEDVTLWPKLGQKGRPKLSYTLPVDTNAAGLPSMILLFMDPTDDAAEPEWTSLLDEEKEANRTGGAALEIIDRKVGDRKEPIIFAGKDSPVGRGWHLVFAYKARLDFQGDNKYVYPNDVKGRFIEGQTLLSSTVKDTPKQPTDVSMYLHRMGESGKPGAQWKYTYTDVDQAAKHSFEELTTTQAVEDIFKAFAVDVPSTSILKVDGTGEDAAGYRTLRAEMTRNREYMLQIRQQLYAGEDQLEDGSQPPETVLDLTRHSFNLPIAPDAVAGGQLKIEMRAPQADGGNTVKFRFSTDQNGAFDLNRITRVDVTATNQTQPGKSHTKGFWGFTGKDIDGTPYLGYDLSLAGSVGDQISFTIKVSYDSGEGGQELLPTDQTQLYAVQNVSTGQYMEWRYVTGGTGTDKEIKRWNSDAWMGLYRVTPADPTHPEKPELKVDTAWELKNTYTSSTADPTVMYLKYSAGGAREMIDGYYPAFKKIGTAVFDQGYELEIDGLNPSVSSVWHTNGLTSIQGHFVTNSANLLAQWQPAGADHPGKYMEIRVYELNENGDKLTPAVDILHEEIFEDDTRSYEWSTDKLKKGKKYRIELYSKMGQPGALADQMMYDNERSQWAIYTVETLRDMVITDIGFSEVTYETYEDKHVEFTYTLPLISGFTIKYELQELQGAGFVNIADHNAVMEAMGYTFDDAKQEWLDKNGNPWTYAGSMKEVIRLNPGGIMKPGHTYRIVITAWDNQDNRVNQADCYGEFTWGTLTEPSFYVEASPTNSGQGMNVKLDPVDVNKVIVGGQYIVILRKEDGEINDFKYDVVHNEEEGIIDMNITDLETNTNYILKVYGRKDIGNGGKQTPLTRDELQDMTLEQRNEVLLYQSTEKTLDSWGGRFDSMRVDINTNRNIKLSLYNAYNLKNIDSIKVTAYWTKDGKGNTKSYQMTQSSGGESLFTRIGTSGNNYSVTLPIGLTDPGVYSITCYLEKDGQVVYSGTYNADFE
ncbi:MAG: hypothetical protein ACLTKI_00255 [Lachnospiraceae bacterium]